MYVSEGYDIATDNAKVNIDADAVLVAVVTDTTFLPSGRLTPTAAVDLGSRPSHLAVSLP